MKASSHALFMSECERILVINVHASTGRGFGTDDGLSMSLYFCGVLFPVTDAVRSLQPVAHAARLYSWVFRSDSRQRVCLVLTSSAEVHKRVP